jgi:hypothetical protein
MDDGGDNEIEPSEEDIVSGTARVQSAYPLLLAWQARDKFIREGAPAADFHEKTIESRTIVYHARRARPDVTDRRDAAKLVQAWMTFYMSRGYGEQERLQAEMLDGERAQLEAGAEFPMALQMRMRTFENKRSGTSQMLQALTCSICKHVYVCPVLYKGACDAYCRACLRGRVSYPVFIQSKIVTRLIECVGVYIDTLHRGAPEVAATMRTNYTMLEERAAIPVELRMWVFDERNDAESDDETQRAAVTCPVCSLMYVTPVYLPDGTDAMCRTCIRGRIVPLDYEMLDFASDLNNLVDEYIDNSMVMPRRAKERARSRRETEEIRDEELHLDYLRQIQM